MLHVVVCCKAQISKWSRPKDANQASMFIKAARQILGESEDPTTTKKILENEEEFTIIIKRLQELELYVPTFQDKVIIASDASAYGWGTHD